MILISYKLINSHKSPLIIELCPKNVFNFNLSDIVNDELIVSQVNIWVVALNTRAHRNGNSFL